MANWIDIQQNTFTRWCNQYLKERGYFIKDLKTDLADGLLLINLLEIISAKSLGRYNRHPVVPYQKLENCNIAIKFIQSEGLKLVNIGGDDISSGRLKLILGLIWTLILRYQIQKGGESGSAKNELLEWVRKKIPEYNIQNFQKDWNDGRAICGLANAVGGGNLVPNHFNLDPKDKLQNAERGIDTAERQLGIPKLILATEMNHPKVDEQAMMTYISFFRDYEESQKKQRSLADQSYAFGPGLQEAIVSQNSEFTVVTPGGKLEVKVIGPKDNAQVKITDKGNGTYGVEYTPKNPGEYEVHVTVDKNHIPGSIFRVTVLEDLSLGGEGKIRVFYSTTSARDEKSRPLQELLEKKNIHTRPDFEPWIPVDIMEPKDRDAVFQKAQTKKLPIVYIDDKYVGDSETIFKLDATGELDRLLRYNEKK
eukprot:TRINITY_DN12709_c0_g1_i1.p1 TRINITY_DN12709_c0_g1~~TRINITY_DN12709_c0_g1_i1.p1  ORF type:complete len:423 (-),score=94.10 TRINITY_DN12709_c0_g1_i1:3-1271(-)